VYPVHPLLAFAIDVAATLEGGEEAYALTHVRVLGRALCPARLLCLVPDHGPGPPGMLEGATLMNPRGMAGTAEGVVGLVLGEEVEGEAVVVGIDHTLGLVLHHLAEVLGPHADDRRVMSVAGMEGAERGRLRTPCALVARGRDLILVPALHVPARGRVLCLTLPTRGTVGVGAGVARVLDL